MFPRIHIEIERWKFNQDEQVYVSTFGNIKDINKKPILPFIGQKGYFSVITGKGVRSVHRLVASTWLIKPSLDSTVDHIDSNRRNNKLSNLQYVSSVENLRRAESKTFVSKDALELDEKTEEQSSQPKLRNSEGFTFRNIKKAANWLRYSSVERKYEKAEDGVLFELIENAANSRNKLGGVIWFYD